MISKARSPDAFKCPLRALKKEIFGFSFDYPLHTVPESSAKDSLHYHLYSDALAWEALRLDPNGIGAADKAVNLVGCKSPHPQLPGPDHPDSTPAYLPSHN